MKPGRNDPCPCGSGEKYKLCCFLQENPVTQSGDFIMEKRIPKARYKTTAIESPQAMVNRQKSQKETQRSIQREKEQEALANSPEVQAHLSEMMKNHYREWIKMKIPVLGGKTPLQAVKTSDGREMVEALIVDIELKSKQIGSPLDPAIIMELRKNLGLLRSEILA